MRVWPPTRMTSSMSLTWRSRWWRCRRCRRRGRRRPPCGRRPPCRGRRPAPPPSARWWCAWRRGRRCARRPWSPGAGSRWS